MGGLAKGCGVLLLAGVAFIALALIVGPSKPTADEIRTGTYCLPGFDGSHRKLRDMVKESLRDPDSFELIDTTITPLGPDGTHTVEMTYRARNGFGGMNVEKTRAAVDKDCNIVRIL